MAGADWRNYVSIASPPASAGTVVLEIQTYDAVPNVTITLPATANGTEDCITFATNMLNSINFYLTASSAMYSGSPVFSDQAILGTFYAGITDNIVSLWSQCRFRLRVKSNDTGADVRIGATPLFLTLAEAKSRAPLMGIDFSNFNNQTLTDSQIVDLLELASGQLSSLINNNLVYACYLHEYIGGMVGSIKLRVGPLGDFDNPMVRRPYMVLVTALPLIQTRLSFDIDRKLRIMNYRFTNQLIDVTEPFEMNNEIKLTFRAGYMNIPSIIKEKTLQITSLIMMNNVKSLGGGSFKVEFRLPTELLNSLALELREYRL